MVTFSKRTTHRDEKFLSGDKPFSGDLGPNRTLDAFDPQVAARKRNNPDHESFNREARTFREIAPLAQMKIDDAARTPAPAFRDERDNIDAVNFLTSYLEGVNRGLIPEEDRVGPDKLNYISSQPATCGSNERSPDTAGKFPGADGVKV